MIYLPSIQELNLIAVVDRGVPNQERIVLRANANVNLAQYALILTYQPDNLSTPINDNFLWLSDMAIDAGTWIFVYTSPGQPRFTVTENTNEPAYILHWGRRNIVFSDPNLVPVLFQLGAMDSGKNKEYLPHTSP